MLHAYSTFISICVKTTDHLNMTLIIFCMPTAYLILKVQDFGNLELSPMYKQPTVVISFLIILKIEEDSGSVSSVRLGIEGLLGHDSPESLCCVLEQGSLSSA